MFNSLQPRGDVGYKVCRLKQNSLISRVSSVERKRVDIKRTSNRSVFPEKGQKKKIIVT